ncbi:MAG: zinc ribbon domain-containing protein [Promethearchaeota archaeon]
MAWVPFIVANRRNKYYRSRGTSAIAALVIFFLIFGVLFFVFFNRMSGFTMPIWTIIIGFGIFLLIITVIIAIAASMSDTYKKPKERHLNSQPYQAQKQTQQTNPYIYQNTIQKQFELPQYKEIKREIPIVSDIKYCIYCGAKVERDAVFCHQCGIKL